MRIRYPIPVDPRFAEVAALAGEPARAAMLHALLDGRALTASELARAATITPQTASGHLARLVRAGLVSVAPQGRHRYHRLGSPAVAAMLELIPRVASTRPGPTRPLLTGPRNAAMRLARTCYDHLAGRLGVAIADALAAGGHIELTPESGLVTPVGARLLQRIGIDVAGLSGARGQRGPVMCRPCLDWSERRPHLAGRLGAALCNHGFEHGWIRRLGDTRAITITADGWRAYRDLLGVRLER